MFSNCLGVLKHKPDQSQIMPVKKKSLKSGGSGHLPKAGHDEEEQHGSWCYNVTIDFIAIVLAVAEIGLVVYVSVSHFSHSQGVIAIAMLSPPFLNFIGVTYFLSNAEERKVLESATSNKCAKDFFQAPLLGPIFTAIQVLIISSGMSTSSEGYARFESLAIKMRQAQSFFGAAPEALVQLTVLLVSEVQVLGLDQYLEIAIVLISVVSLSEANMYALTSNYFRLFHNYKPMDWKLPHLLFWQKCLLFFHAFFSIGSRLAACACLKAAVKYILMNNPTTVTPIAGTAVAVTPSPGTAMTSTDANQLGYYLTVFFLVEIGFRMVVYYIVRLIKFMVIDKGIPSGCFEAINYGWRATILDFGFQSKNIAVQLFFYLENAFCFIVWWVAVSYEAIERPMIAQIKANLLVPLASIFIMFTLISVFMLFAVTGLKLHTLRSPFSGKEKDEDEVYNVTEVIVRKKKEKLQK